MTHDGHPGAPRRDVAAEITGLIIEKLADGVLPWSRPWGLSGEGGRPLRHCGTPYAGINTLYLWAIGDARLCRPHVDDRPTGRNARRAGSP